MTTSKETESKNSGGSVLKPENVIDAGIDLFSISDNNTSIHFLVNDLDFTSVYPSVGIVLNGARETTKWIVKSIEKFINNESVNLFQTTMYHLFSSIINLKENAVDICFTHLNLPNYDKAERELNKFFQNEIKSN